MHCYCVGFIRPGLTPRVASPRALGLCADLVSPRAPAQISLPKTMSSQDPGAIRVNVHEVSRGDRAERADSLVVEEPMEIRIAHGPAHERTQRSVSVTMRTPGQDFELAIGFLFTEGLIQSAQDVSSVDFCGPPAPGRDQSNIVKVELNPRVEVDAVRLQRNFFSTSSCGICGKASLEALNFDGVPIPTPSHPAVTPGVIEALPDQLRATQQLFEHTGGLHAAGLFDAQGQLVEAREDVGRHNALDKLVGARLIKNALPARDQLLVVSGRSSFEIMQKTLMAGIPIVVAVGAPSSLAVDLAERFNMTLIGFARGHRFNIYAGAQRVTSEEAR